MMVTKLYNKDIFNRRKEMKRWKLWYKEQFGGRSDIPFEPPKHFSCRCQSYKNTHIQRDRIKGKNLNNHKVFTAPAYPKTAQEAMENMIVSTKSLRHNPYMPGKWPPPPAYLGIGINDFLKPSKNLKSKINDALKERIKKILTF